jgi:hypothetical protein
VSERHFTRVTSIVNKTTPFSVAQILSDFCFVVSEIVILFCGNTAFKGLAVIFRNVTCK